MKENRLNVLSVSMYTAAPNLSSSDYINVIKKLYSLERDRYLLYFKQYSMSQLSASNFYEMAYVAKNYLKEGKTAYVAETLAEYGQLQHYMIYAKEMKTAHKVELFFNREKAEKWLNYN